MFPYPLRSKHFLTQRQKTYLRKRLSRNVNKRNFGYIRPAKILISLRIRTV